MARTGTCMTMLLQENVPAEQLEHAELPSVLNVPLPHAEHVAVLTAPSTVENVSAGHNKHAAMLFAATVDEYVPARHCVHVAELVAATVLENVPAPHAVHDWLPATA